MSADTAAPATPRTLAAAVAAHATTLAGKTAVVCEDRVRDYAWLYETSGRIAAALRGHGVDTRDRIAYLAKESEFYYATVLACARIGAVLVPVNWRLTRREVDHVLRDSGARLVFVEREFRAVVDDVLARLPHRAEAVEVDGPAPGDRGGALLSWCATAPELTEPVTGPDDPVVQIYTSGTTGLPKGVVLANRSFFTLPDAMRAAGVSWIDWQPDDVNLISLPGLGIAGIGWFMHGFVAGGTNVVMRVFEPQEAVRLIRTHQVTTTFAAPAMLRMMLDQRGVSPSDFASFRKICYGAAPISESLLRACIEIFDCELAQIYSSTEAGSVAVCLPPSAHQEGSPLLRAAGLPCPGNEVKIVDREGRELPPGEIGQVCIRTPARMLGYWNQPAATAKALADGWLHMGDAGYLDEDGYLFLCDRIDDTIIVAGQNIYPAEVEKRLGDHPAVADVAVVGVPDSAYGDSVHACVVPRPGTEVTARELMLFLRGQIADFKIPTAFHFERTLPRNPGGKVLRREVRDRLSGRAT